MNDRGAAENNGLSAAPAFVRGEIPGRYPSAEQWLDVFRNAQMPLWLADLTAVRRAVDEVLATGVEDLPGWLDSHPEFLSRILDQIRFLELSDQAVKLSGARDREHFVSSLDRFVVPESLPGFKRMVTALAEGSQLAGGAASYRTLDGRTVHTWSQGSFLKSEDGGDLLLLAMTDISSLKEMQDKLSASEHGYRMLVETARDMILCHDLEGRITFVNQAGLELLGRPREELVGSMADDLVPESLHGEMMRRAEKRTSGDLGVFLYETRYVTASGAEVPVEVSSCLIRPGEAQEEMGQVLVVARDISERKRADEERLRLEARLRNAQKLESLGVMADGIAHDFNNFLVAIMGSAELIRQDLDPASPHRENVNLILEAADSIADLCRQMQHYAAEAPSGVRPGDLSEVVRSFSRLIDVSVSGRAQVSLELAEDLPRVRIDETQIGQVVLHLVGNAVESMGGEGGVVAVRTGCREIGAAEVADIVGSISLNEGRYVFCQVRDSGCGMDPETAARLFEPFFTTKFVGRGMGLFAAQGIVQSHGGGFLLETQPEQGTTITFLLPALRAEQTAAAARKKKTVPDVDLAGRTVMIVDDQKEVCEVAESYLRRLGCRVLMAPNGFDAIRIFSSRHQEIDLVLMDMAMEGMDGVTTGRRMRTIRPGVPIVFVSGFSLEAVNRRAESLEPFGVLAKPFRLRDLRGAINRVLTE